MSQTTETKTKTPVERVEEWIAALRSGKYAQCREVLHDGVGFCCLGVMCDLYDPEPWVPFDGVYAYGFVSGYGITKLPTDDMRKLFSLRASEVALLSRMNDNGCGFPEIAKYIKSTILPRVRREQEGR